jgi:hypothetical protein
MVVMHLPQNGGSLGRKFPASRQSEPPIPRHGGTTRRHCVFGTLRFGTGVAPFLVPCLLLLAFPRRSSLYGPRVSPVSCRSGPGSMTGSFSCGMRSECGGAVVLSSLSGSVTGSSVPPSRHCARGPAWILRTQRRDPTHVARRRARRPLVVGQRTKAEAISRV